MTMQVGDRVKLAVPENPLLHGKVAQVVKVFEWGAMLKTHAAKSGQFRALHSEMDNLSEAERTGKSVQSKEAGYTGDACGKCGSFAMRRNGACLLCDACGETSGCS